jgi:hypothetical protein
MFGGATITLYGVVRRDPTLSLGGACLTMIALTLIALFFIHRWFTNTNEERRVLAERTRAADDERNRYVSLKAALENEQGRLSRDMAAERAALAVRLATEREAQRVEFEELRASLIAETMEATVRMFHNGKFAPEVQKIGNLIPFPEQQHDRLPARARSHDQGSARP